MANEELILWGVVFGLPFLMLLIVLFLERRNSKKAVILYFESNSICRIIHKKVEDGLVKFNDKIHHVGTTKPYHLPSGFIMKTWKPFYILHYNSATPLSIHKTEKIISGASLKALYENKTLQQLLTPKSSSGQMILFLLVGAAIGAIMGYLFGVGVK